MLRISPGSVPSALIAHPHHPCEGYILRFQVVFSFPLIHSAINASSQHHGVLDKAIPFASINLFETVVASLQSDLHHGRQTRHHRRNRARRWLI
jgi:hypothetical protein